MPVQEKKVAPIMEEDPNEVDKENINGGTTEADVIVADGDAGEGDKDGSSGGGEGEEGQQQSGVVSTNGGATTSKTDASLGASITLALSRLGLSDGPEGLGLPDSLELADVSTDSSDNSSVCSWSSSSFAASGSDLESDYDDMMDDDNSVISTDSCPSEPDYKYWTGICDPAKEEVRINPLFHHLISYLSRFSPHNNV